MRVLFPIISPAVLSEIQAKQEVWRRLSVLRVDTRLAREMLNVGSCRVESRHSLYSRVSTGCHGVVSPMLFSFAEALTIFPKNFSFSISIRDS